MRSRFETRVAIALFLAATAESRCFAYKMHREQLVRFDAWSGGEGSRRAWARQVRKMVSDRGWCEAVADLRDAGAFRLGATVEIVADPAFQSWFKTAFRPVPRRSRIMYLINRATAPWRDPRVITDEDMARVPLAQRKRIAESNSLLEQAWEIRRSERGARGSEPLLRKAIALVVDRSIASATPLTGLADVLLRIVRKNLSSRSLTIETALVIALVVEVAVTSRNQFRFQADWRVAKSLLEVLFESRPRSANAFASWAMQRAVLVAAASAAYACHVDELLKIAAADSVGQLARDLDELTAATPNEKDARVAIVSTIAVVAAAAGDRAAFKRAMKELLSTRTERPEDDFPLIVAAICGHDRANALGELDRWRAERRGTTHRDPYWREMLAMAAANPTITFVDLCSRIEDQHAAGRNATPPRSTSPVGDGPQGSDRRVRPSRRRSRA